MAREAFFPSVYFNVVVFSGSGISAVPNADRFNIFAAQTLFIFIFLFAAFILFSLEHCMGPQWSAYSRAFHWHAWILKRDSIYWTMDRDASKFSVNWIGMCLSNSGQHFSQHRAHTNSSSKRGFTQIIHIISVGRPVDQNQVWNSLLSFGWTRFDFVSYPLWMAIVKQTHTHRTYVREHVERNLIGKVTDEVDDEEEK